MRTTIWILLAGCASHANDNGIDASAGADTSTSAIDAPATGMTIDQCFPGLTDPNHPHPNYDQFHPVVNADCTGTNYQNITGVEKLVFLGDSITAGTPPTLLTDYYRAQVGDAMKTKFGASLEIKDCSKWGAKTSDLAAQIGSCIGDPEPKRTLIVFTIGGNDMNDVQKAAATETPQQTLAHVDVSVANLEAALTTLTSAQRF